jgi:hypothetical protein
MKIQESLLILYTIFVIGPLSHLAFAQHTVGRSQFESGVFGHLRNAVATNDIKYARKNTVNISILSKAASR